MSIVDEVCGLARNLPGTEEYVVADQLRFRVNRLVYALISADETWMGCAFPKAEREHLIAVEPNRFFLPPPGQRRYHWVCAWLAELDPVYARELITDAWYRCVPQRVRHAYLPTLAVTTARHRLYRVALDREHHRR